MFERLSLALEYVLLELLGKRKAAAEKLVETYQDKHTEIVLLRAAMRKNGITKTDSKRLAGLESQLKEIGKRKRYIGDRRFPSDLYEPDDLAAADRLWDDLVQMPFIMSLLLVNASLLFLLCYFAHVPQQYYPLIIPTTVIFSIWIWSSEKDRFLLRAGNHWKEMADDFSESVKKRRTKK